MIRLVKIKKVIVTLPTDGKNEAEVALTRHGHRAQETGLPGTWPAVSHNCALPVCPRTCIPEYSLREMSTASRKKSLRIDVQSSFIAQSRTLETTQLRLAR